MESRQFRRADGVLGVGFIQTHTGRDVAAIAWPDAEPRRFGVDALAGHGIELIDLKSLTEAVEVDQTPSSAITPEVPTPVVAPIAEQLPPSANSTVLPPAQNIAVEPFSPPATIVPVEPTSPVLGDNVGAVAPIESPASVATEVAASEPAILPPG